MSFDRLSVTERKIIDRYLTRLSDLAKENPAAKIKVQDGEETVYSGPFDRKAIKAQIGHTEETYITVDLGNDVRHRVWLIHGNEEDVVSDTAWTTAGAFLDDLLTQGLDDGL